MCHSVSDNSPGFYFPLKEWDDADYYHPDNENNTPIEIIEERLQMFDGGNEGNASILTAARNQHQNVEQLGPDYCNRFSRILSAAVKTADRQKGSRHPLIKKNQYQLSKKSRERQNKKFRQVPYDINARYCNVQTYPSTINSFDEMVTGTFNELEDVENSNECKRHSHTTTPGYMKPTFAYRQKHREQK